MLMFDTFYHGMNSTINSVFGNMSPTNLMNLDNFVLKNQGFWQKRKRPFLWTSELGCGYVETGLWRGLREWCGPAQDVCPHEGCSMVSTRKPKWRDGGRNQKYWIVPKHCKSGFSWLLFKVLIELVISIVQCYRVLRAPPKKNYLSSVQNFEKSSHSYWLAGQDLDQGSEWNSMTG